MAGVASSSRQRSKIAPYLMVLPALAYLALFFVVPFWSLLRTSLSSMSGSVFLPTLSFAWNFGNYGHAFTEYQDQIIRSFTYALVATLVCILLAYPLAYVIAFKAGRYKNLILGLVILPFFVTFLIRTLAWKTILADDYKEDFNDNEQWFAKVKEPLSRKQDIGADLVVPTTFMASRIQQLGWLNEITDAGWSNKKNLRDDLLEASVDPGRKFSAPYMSGLVGIAYNKAATKRDIKTIDDMWDPAFKGKVSLFSDSQDALGMLMMSQGGSPTEPNSDSIKKAVDLVKEQKDRGQIRRFTGNDYADDLAAGNIAIAQAYSGDVVQLQADNPDLVFVVPESGGTTFVDTMVIPYTTQNQNAAEAWINYVYDRKNYAKLIAFVQYVPVLSDMTDELNKLDPKLAANPLINPPKATLDMVKGWAPLTDEQTQEYNTLYAAVTGG